MLPLLHFARHWCVLNRSRHISNKYGQIIGQILKKRLQFFFLNQDGYSRHLEFWSICVLNRSCNISFNFSANWSNSTEMATVIRNPRWRRLLSCHHFWLNCHWEKRIPSSQFTIENSIYGMKWYGNFCYKPAKSKQKWSTFLIFLCPSIILMNLKTPNPKKARVSNKTRRLSRQACESEL